MKFLKTTNTRTKLYMATVLLVIFSAILSYLGYKQAVDMKEHITVNNEEHFAAAMGVAEIRADVNNARAALVTMFAESDKLKQEAQHIKLKEITVKIDDRLRALMDNKVFPQDMLEDLKKINEVWIVFRNTRDAELIPAIFSGNMEKARGLALGIQAERYKSFLDLSGEFIKKETEESTANVIDSTYIAKRLRNGFIAVFIILVVLNLVVNKLVMKFMIEPLADGVKLAEAIAKGDMSHKIAVLPDREDEVGHLMKSLDNMSENLNRFLRQIGLSSSNVAASSERLSASSVQIAKGAEITEQKATQVATAATEMSATIVDVAKNASHVSEAVKEADAAAKKGGEIIEDTVNGMNGISGSVQEAASVITELGSRSKEIGRIIMVIDDIADQTNLLALNAAIEAARAGEQGRGFAVVADEVRKLAERTTLATKEISSMIKAIQEDTKRAVSSMDASKREVEAELKLSKEAGGAISLIISSFNRVAEMIHQIAVSAEEQSTVSEQISMDIESVASVTKETAAGSTEIASSAAGLSSVASQLEELVSRFDIERRKDRTDKRVWQEAERNEYRKVHHAVFQA